MRYIKQPFANKLISLALNIFCYVIYVVNVEYEKVLQIEEMIVSTEYNHR